MFRRGRHAFTEQQAIINTGNDSEATDIFIEASSSLEWLEKHPLSEEDALRLKAEQQRSASQIKTFGKQATRRGLWDLPDWY